MQNCLRCRHFITGPVFLGGLASITNEILLEANDQSEVCQNLQDRIDSVNDKINHFDRQEYISNLKQTEFDTDQRSALEFRVRKLESEYESSAKKMDMLLCDLQSSYKLIQLSQAVANSPEKSDSKDLALIKMPGV